MLLRRRMGRRPEAFHIVGGRGRHRLVESLGIVHRALHVGLDGDDPGQTGELEGVVGVEDCCHELGKRWAPKYGVVGEVDVCHIERDVLRAEVVSPAERDRQLDLPQRDGLLVGYATERGGRGELALPDLYPAEHFWR